MSPKHGAAARMSLWCYSVCLVLATCSAFRVYVFPAPKEEPVVLVEAPTKSSTPPPVIKKAAVKKPHKHYVIKRPAPIDDTRILAELTSLK